MGTRITGTGPKRPEYPEISVGCLNTVAHAGYQIVNFKIPRGKKSANCPECGRRAGRK